MGLGAALSFASASPELGNLRRTRVSPLPAEMFTIGHSNGTYCLQSWSDMRPLDRSSWTAVVHEVESFYEHFDENGEPVSESYIQFQVAMVRSRRYISSTVEAAEGLTEDDLQILDLTRFLVYYGFDVNQEHELVKMQVRLSRFAKLCGFFSRSIPSSVPTVVPMAAADACRFFRSSIDRAGTMSEGYEFDTRCSGGWFA
jgi:hypothetical protein